MTAKIVAVRKSGTYTFSKPNQGGIRLLAGLGVEGDVHMGETVKHRSRVAKKSRSAKFTAGAFDPC